MASIYGNLLKQKKAFAYEKNSTPTVFVCDTNMAAVLLFWDTNMAAVTSSEDTLLLALIDSLRNIPYKPLNVPYKPLKAVLARQIKIICSIKCDSFFFSVSSVFASEDQQKGVTVMCHFATPTEMDQLNDSNSCTRLSNGN